MVTFTSNQPDIFSLSFYHLILIVCRQNTSNIAKLKWLLRVRCIGCENSFFSCKLELGQLHSLQQRQLTNGTVVLFWKAVYCFPLLSMGLRI